MTIAGAAISCSYCGLPLASGWWPGLRRSSPQASDRPVFCCSGCRFAAEVTAESRAGAPINKPLARLGIAIFLTVNVVMFTMVLWTDDVYAPATAAQAGPMAESIRWLSLLLSVPVIWLLSGPLAANAWQELRRGIAAVDMLLVLGVAAAFGYSVVSVIRGRGHVYFEVACVVLVLVTLGRWLESLGKLRASEAIESLTKLLPPRVLRVSSGREETVALEDLRRGDCIRIQPGQRIAADGRIIEGMTAIDEQSVTGESRLIVKQLGDPVYGGTLNLDGPLVVEVDGDGGQGTVQRMVQSLRQARLERGCYQRLADRAARWFLPATIAIAVGALVWHTSQRGVEDGVLSAMAVLLIACPCALGLATPLAIWAAIGAASKHQVLIRHGDALERLAAVRTVFFDKTGTLSSGECEVSRLILTDHESWSTVLNSAGQLAASSMHPYSVAVVRFSAFTPTSSGALTGVKNHPGRGLTYVNTHGEQISLGSEGLMSEMNLTMPASLKSKLDRFDARSASWVMIGWSGLVRGVFVIEERIRPESQQALRSLRESGLAVQILSGDRRERADEFGRTLDVAVQGVLLPEDKVTAVRLARQRSTGVAMVGDGLNDAAALAAADVGIAMGCGADVSREAADVCLLGNDLSRIPWVIDLSRRTVRVIRQNLFWSLAYNAVGMALAVFGLLNPILAAAAMMVSSFFVVTNSLRIGSGQSATQPASKPEMADRQPAASAAPLQQPAELVDV